MASEIRRAEPDLITRLQEAPGEFEFSQAVRVLEFHARERSPGAGAAAPVGMDHAPDRECLRFKVVPSLSFAVAPVREVQVSAQGPSELRVSFLSLINATGTLPPHYSELLMRRLQVRDDALRDFLDLFHHRAVSAFFRAWRKYRFPFSWEFEHFQKGGEDPFTACLYSFIGFGTAHLRNRQELPDERLLYHAGHLSRTTRSAAALEDVLTDLFGHRFRVEQFVGRWLTLPEEERSRMPTRGSEPDRRSQLGGGLLLGDKVWDLQSKVRLHAGPLTHAQFTELQPGGPARGRLKAILRTFLGRNIDFDLEVELLPGEAPAVHLGASGLARFALGRNGWLQARAGSRSGSGRALFSLDRS